MLRPLQQVKTPLDYFLASVHLEPLKIVGYEGLWGCIVMAGLVLPLLQHSYGEDGGGIHEDTLDSLQVNSQFPQWAMGCGQRAFVA